jgi:hypothetical protein
VLHPAVGLLYRPSTQPELRTVLQNKQDPKHIHRYKLLTISILVKERESLLELGNLIFSVYHSLSHGVFCLEVLVGYDAWRRTVVVYSEYEIEDI